MKLERNDLYFAAKRLPKELVFIMKTDAWLGKIFVGGGYLRSVVTREAVNDVDVFVGSKDSADFLKKDLQLASGDKRIRVIETKNAYTLLGFSAPIQIIHRWTFDNVKSVADSFDFTICCAAIQTIKLVTGAITFDSWCDDRFYTDLAGKRLIYRKPICNEDAGGSLLRVLKYYQKGYAIPLDSYADVIARMLQAVDMGANKVRTEEGLSSVICGLLREVDPNVDPHHIFHLPSSNQNEDNQGN